MLWHCSGYPWNYSLRIILNSYDVLLLYAISLLPKRLNELFTNIIYYTTFIPTIIYIIFKIFILIQTYCTFFLAVFYAKTCGFILHFLPFLVFNLLPTNLFYISTYLFSFNTFQDAWNLIQIISNKCKLLIRRNYYLK